MFESKRIKELESRIEELELQNVHFLVLVQTLTNVMRNLTNTLNENQKPRDLLKVLADIQNNRV